MAPLRNLYQMRRIREYGTVDHARLQRQCEKHLQQIELLVRGKRMEASHFMPAPAAQQSSA